MNRNRVVRGIAANGFSTGSSILVQLAAVPVLVGCWGLPLYGAWLLFSTIPSYLAVSNFGLAVVAGNDVAAALGRGDADRAGGIFRTAWAAITGFSVLLLAVAVAATWLVPAQILPAPDLMTAGSARATVSALILYGVAALQADALMAGYRASGHFARGTMILSFVGTVERVLPLMAALAGGGLLVAAIIMAVVRLAGSVFMQIDLPRRAPVLRPGVDGFSGVELRRQARLAGGVVLHPLGMALNLQGPLIILGLLFPPAAVGLFGATRTLTRLSLQATNVVSTALMPEFAMAFGRADTAAMRRLYAINLVSSWVLMAIAFVAICAFGQLFMRYWTVGQGIPDFWLLAGLALAAVLQGCWNASSNLLLASNRQYAYTPAFVTICVVMLGAMYPLGRTLGQPAVVAALCAAEIVMVIWVQRKIVRHGIGTLADARAMIMAAMRRVRTAGVSPPPTIDT